MAGTGKVSIALPTAVAAAEDAPLRATKYGELSVAPYGDVRSALADEGSYFVLTNPTPGTSVDTIAAGSSYASTSPYVMILNAASAGGKRLYLDYVKIITGTAGLNGTNLRFAIVVDNGLRTYTSGGAAATPKNVNMDSSVATGTVCYTGALVVSAATAAVRRLSSGLLKTGISVAGDTYVLTCGRNNGVGSAVATINSVTFPCAPVIVGPQQTLLIHLWAASQDTAASYEFEVGWWER